MLVAQSCLTFGDPRDWGDYSSITRMLEQDFQGMFPAQGSSSGLLPYKQILYWQDEICIILYLFSVFSLVLMYSLRKC